MARRERKAARPPTPEPPSAARPSPQPRLTVAAWHAFADLAACAAAIGRASDGACVCRLLPRMRRARERLDAELDAAKRTYSPFGAPWLREADVANGAVFGASWSAQNLYDAVIAVAEGRGLRSDVLPVAADLAAGMAKADRACRRVFKALAAGKRQVLSR